MYVSLELSSFTASAVDNFQDQLYSEYSYFLYTNRFSYQKCSKVKQAQKIFFKIDHDMEHFYYSQSLLHKRLRDRETL